MHMPLCLPILSDLWTIIGNNGLGSKSRDAYVDMSVDVDELNRTFVSNQLVAPSHFDDNFYDFSGGNKFSFHCIDEIDLFTAFSAIKSNAAGVDGFTLKFFKVVFPYVSKLFLHLVNTILLTSVFPAQWKIGKIVPIKKAGNTNSLRPISLLPILSKIVEHVLKMQLLSYVDGLSLLNDCQCGFRSNRNTSALLVGLTDKIRSNFNDRDLSLLLSLDLEKAFDRVDHAMLIRKLSSIYDFDYNACRLISSYLIGRSQYVCLNGFSSSILSVSSGVPQGSVLGPVLFTLFVNDLFDKLRDNCVTFCFADDIQILFKGEYQFLDVLKAKADYVLQSLQQWMMHNNLTVNPAKTKAMIFSTRDVDLSLNYGGVNIEYVYSLTILGVILDDRLCFDHHIDSVVSRTCLTLRKLYNSNLILPHHVKRKLVHGLIMPNILYGIEVYAGTIKQNMKRVNLAFNGAIRYMFSLNRRTHVTDFVTMFLGCTFYNYVNFRSLFLFYKSYRNKCPDFLLKLIVFSHSARCRQIILPKLNRHMDKSFQVRVARMFNALPGSLRTFSMSNITFRNSVLQHLLSSN